MAKRYYTDVDVRGSLEAKLLKMKQAEIARVTDMNPQNLSTMVLGAPISARLAKWLGYEKATGLYRKAK
jgi:hypothetical protein